MVEDVNVVSAQGPDLRIASAGVLGPPTIGVTVYITALVQNTGPISTGTWFFLDAYIDSATPPAPRAAGPYYAIVPALPEGASLLVTVTVPALSEGTHTFYLQAATYVPGEGNDPSFGRVAETNEENNIGGAYTFTVGLIKVYLPIVMR